MSSVAEQVRVAWASPRVRTVVNAAIGIAILAGVAVHAGAEPFVRGLASVTPGAAGAAIALTALATAAAAWRWRLVASGYGVPLGGGAAVAAYYRSQFLNTVLPGGVVGDVHRDGREDRDADRDVQDRARASRRPRRANPLRDAAHEGLARRSAWWLSLIHM